MYMCVYDDTVTCSDPGDEAVTDIIIVHVRTQAMRLSLSFRYRNPFSCTTSARFEYMYNNNYSSMLLIKRPVCGSDDVMHVTVGVRATAAAAAARLRRCTWVEFLHVTCSHCVTLTCCRRVFGDWGRFDGRCTVDAMCRSTCFSRCSEHCYYYKVSVVLCYSVVIDCLHWCSSLESSLMFLACASVYCMVRLSLTLTHRLSVADLCFFRWNLHFHWHLVF